MAPRKERTAEQIQHRRDTVRNNVARYRANKRQRDIESKKFGSEDNTTLSSNDRRFVNKSSSDFRKAPNDLSRSKRPNQSPVETRNESTTTTLGSGLDSNTIRLQTIGNNTFHVHQQREASSSVFAPLRKQSGPFYSRSIHHHWLTLLPQYVKSSGTPQCLALIVQAILLRAAAKSKSSTELLHRSGQVYGNALRVFRDDLSPGGYVGSASTGTEKAHCKVITLATSLALATYELSDPDPGRHTIYRWASHIRGLDAFVYTHSSAILQDVFGRELFSCWITQRAWWECLSASDAHLGSPECTGKERQSESRGDDTQHSTGFSDPNEVHHTLNGSIRLTHLETRSYSQRLSYELKATALDLMKSCAQALRAAKRDLLSNATDEAPSGSVSALRERLYDLRRRVGLRRTSNQGKDFNTHSNHAKSLDVIQLQAFCLGAEWVMALTEAQAAKRSRPAATTSQTSPSSAMARIKIELLDICNVMVSRFGFVGQLSSVLPRALVELVDPADITLHDIAPG